MRYVLEGSVRKAAGRVRIAVKLIDAEDGAQIWTHRFEDTLEDVFALQDKVALSVAGVIEPTVQQAEIRRAAARPTENMGSYDLYLRALPLQRTSSEPICCGARSASRAIALDPDYRSRPSRSRPAATGSSSYRLVGRPGRSSSPGLELAHRALKAAGDEPRCSAVGRLDHRISSRTIWMRLGPRVDRALTLNPGSASAWNYGAASARCRRASRTLAIDHLATAHATWTRWDLLGDLS